MASRRLQVVLDLDTGRYTGKMTQAASVTKRFQGVTNSGSKSVRQMGRSFDNLNNKMSSPLSKLRDYVLVLSNIRLAILNVRDMTVGWVGAALKQSATVERLTVLMKGLSNANTELGKSQEATRNLQMLFKEARRTGFAVDALADSFVKMKSGGIDPSAGGLQALNNAVANFGGTSDTMHRASIAIQQMAGKGVISMEELRQQLGEAVPTAMMDMARAAGMALPVFTDLVSKGVVQAKPALELMFREFDILYQGAGEAIANTMTGQIAQFQTNLMELSTAFTGLDSEEGVFSEAKDALKEINEAMRSSEGQVFAADIGSAVASVMRALMSAGKFIVKFRKEIGIMVKAAISGFLAIKAVALFQYMMAGMKAVTVASKSAFFGLTRISQLHTNAGVAASKSSGLAQGATAGWARSLNGLAVIQARGIVLIERRNKALAQGVVSSGLASTAATKRAASIAIERNAIIQAIAAEDAKIVAGKAAAISEGIAITRHGQSGAALKRLASANGQVSFATQRLGDLTKSLTLTEGRLRVAVTATKAAINAETAAIAANTIGTKTLTVAQRAMTVATRSASLAAKGLAMSVNLILGPLGILAMLLYSAASAAGVFENRANKAAAANARLMQGIVDADALAQSKAERDRLRAENVVIESKLSGATRSGGRRGFGLGASGKREIAVQKRADNLREIAKYEEGIARGRNSMNIDEGQKAGEYLNYQSEEKLRPLKRQYEELENDKDASLAELNALADKIDSEQTSIHENVIAGLTAKIKQADDAGNKNQLRVFEETLDQYKESAGLVDGVRLSNDELRASLVIAGEAGATGSRRRTAALTVEQRAQAALEKKYDSSRDKYKKMIGNQAGDIAELNASMTGAETKLAKFNARVEAGLFGDALPGELAALRMNFIEMDRLAEEADWTKGLRRLRKEVAQTNADANAMWKALQADNTGKAFEDYDRQGGVRAKYAEQFKAAAGNKERLAELNAEVDMVIRNLDRIDAATATNNWRIMAEEIQVSLMDENEARQFVFDNEVVRQERLLELVRNNAAAGSEERILAERRFYNWKRIAEEKMLREGEHGTIKQARQWAKLGQSIDASLTRALGSFVDGMFDAEFNFGKFAVSLIKELVKIIIKAMIAYAILSALGLANNSAGQPVSLGSFVKGQVGQGFGGTGGAGTDIGNKLGSVAPSVGVPLAHIGGMIGNLRQSANVSPAVFKFAKSYHTGTNNIGGRALRSGEVPMIGLKGEAVLTEGQQADIRNKLQAKGANNAPGVTINLINNSGQELTAETSEPEFNGREMIVSVVVEEAGREGPLRDMLSTIGKS